MRRKAPGDIFSKPNVKHSVPTTMITVSTQHNVDSILLALTASEGQPGPMQFVVDSRCLPRRAGNKGYEDGSQMTCSWGPRRLLCRTTPLSQLFRCTSRLHWLAGGFWLTECIFYATFGTRVRWTAKEEAMSPLGTANSVTPRLLGSVSLGFFSPLSPLHKLSSLSFWGQSRSPYACLMWRTVQYVLYAKNYRHPNLIWNSQSISSNQSTGHNTKRNARVMWINENGYKLFFPKHTHAPC